MLATFVNSLTASSSESMSRSSGRADPWQRETRGCGRRHIWDAIARSELRGDLMGELEIRNLELEVRVEGEDKEPQLVGYAVRWDERSQPLPFIERFKKGAFSNALANGRDVLALVDHDRSKVIGRRSTGTLQLEEDDHGLRVVIRPNVETSYGRDIVAAVRRGDVSGLSVGFVATREQWVADTEAGQVREVLEADLREVSIASMPAYVGTSVQQRNKELKDMEERKVQVATATEEREDRATDTGAKEKRTT